MVRKIISGLVKSILEKTGAVSNPSRCIYYYDCDAREYGDCAGSKTDENVCSDARGNTRIYRKINQKDVSNTN